MQKYHRDVLEQKAAALLQAPAIAAVDPPPGMIHSPPPPPPIPLPLPLPTKQNGRAPIIPKAPLRRVSQRRERRGSRRHRKIAAGNRETTTDSR